MKRRSFLKKTSVGAAVAGAAPVVAMKTMEGFAEGRTTGLIAQRQEFTLFVGQKMYDLLIKAREIPIYKRGLYYSEGNQNLVLTPMFEETNSQPFKPIEP